MFQLQSERHRTSLAHESSSVQEKLAGPGGLSRQADTLMAGSRHDDQISTQLFLKDIKTFRGIQKAAENCAKRKTETQT